MHLDEQTSGDLADGAGARASGRPVVLAVPLGSTEQHGPHLPLGTDTLVAVALCERLAAAVPGVVVAPALAYGSAGEHAGFAGTVSIGRDATELVVVELVRSAVPAWADAVVLVNGHGGNREPVQRAAATLGGEQRPTLAWWPPPGPGHDAHAGRTETSVLLALHPSLVRVERAVAGNVAPLATLLPLLRRSGVAAVSPNGVLGDPAGATAEEGHRILDAWAADLLARVAGLLARPSGPAAGDHGG